MIKEIPQEVLDYLGKFEWFDISKLIIDQSDGLWIYDGTIDVSDNRDFVEFPKLFKQFKEIKGNLNCSETPLKSFEGLEGLKTIGEGLWCSYTRIKSFKGLEGLQTIGGDLGCYSTPLESFKGLEGLQTIGGSLWCSNTPLKSFEGLEGLKTIGRSLYCSGTPLKSFVGLDGLQKIGGTLDCSECNDLKTFECLNPLINIEGVNGYKTNPISRNPEFLQWQEHARKSKQIKEISKFLECVWL